MQCSEQVLENVEIPVSPLSTANFLPKKSFICVIYFYTMWLKNENRQKKKFKREANIFILSHPTIMSSSQKLQSLAECTYANIM